MRLAKYGSSLLLVLALGCGSDKKSLTGNAAHNAMLQDLGVTTDIGARKTPAGKAVAANYNPIRRSLTPLHKRSEIFVAGAKELSGIAGVTPGTVHAALDWPKGAATLIPSSLQGDDSWLKVPKAMATADVDGDGLDEILIAYLKTSTQGQGKELVVRVVDRDKTAYTIVRERVVASYADSDITEYPTAEFWSANFSVACGDVDGNGQAETLVAFNGSVFLLGDRAKDFGVVKSINYQKSADTKYKVLRAAAGDLNDDGADELVVVESSLQASVYFGAARYHIYSGLALNEIAGAALSVTKGATTVTLRASNVAVGDLDGDGLNEVLFVGVGGLGFAIDYMLVLEPWNEGASRFDYALLPDYESFTARAALIPGALIADFDGDGKKEMLAQRRIYENFAETKGVFSAKSVDVWGGDVGVANEMMMVAADIDGDLRDEVVYLGDSWQELLVVGLDESGQWTRKQRFGIGASGEFYPYVAAGDFDGDSTIVRFVNSEILFTDPHPIVVLASNPFWEGISMDGETSFGTTSSTGTSKEQSVGFSVGYSLGYENETPLWKASVKASVEAAFDWTAAQSVAFEESYTYSTSNEDKVIFTTVPYDVYYYEVVAADPDNQNMVGTTITVNLPRKPVTLAVERGFYNEKNGDAPDVDSTVLSHTVGKPLSYPTSADAKKLIDAGGGVMSTKILTVGEGSGGESIEMGFQKEQTYTFAFDWSVTIEAEVGSYGWATGLSAGFHYGESYSVTAGNGAVYGGRVGDIPRSSFSGDKVFSWGVFTYGAALGPEKFVVVQYYTQGPSS